MKRNYYFSIPAALTAILYLCSSCHGAGNFPPSQEDDNHQEQPQDHSLYYCAVEYNPEYDWKEDILGDAVDTKLVLYKDHKEIARVDISASEHLSSNCDLHRIYEGALFTVHEISGYTIIRRNGEYAAGWEGRDVMEDFMVRGGKIHSLCCTPGSGGITYRIGEDVILRETSAAPVGGLYVDRGQVCFAYRKDSDSGAAYFLCADGKPEQVRTAGSVTEILAIRRHQGVVNTLAREAEISGIVWAGGNSTRVIEPQDCISIRDCGFVVTSDDLLAHFQGRVRDKDWSGMVWNDFFWSSSGLEKRTEGAEQAVSALRDSDRLCFAVSPAAGSGRLRVICGDSERKLRDDYCLISPYAVCSAGGKFAIGVNDSGNSNRPVVIYGAETVEMDFNGFFTRFVLP